MNKTTSLLLTAAFVLVGCANQGYIYEKSARIPVVATPDVLVVGGGGLPA